MPAPNPPPGRRDTAAGATLRAPLNDRLREPVARLRAFAARPVVKRLQRALHVAFLIAVVAYLFRQFSAIGWSEVIASLPTTGWFYLFFFMRYLALPLSELALYERIWGVRLLGAFPAFLRKRVYNFGVFAYAGEGFLTLWARRALPLSTRTILTGVKDNNLLSAFTSNLFTVGLLIFLAASGALATALGHLPAGAAAIFGLAFAIAVVAIVAMAAFRRRLLSLPAARAPGLLGVHVVRMATMLFLQASMYSAALPGAPAEAWLIFLTVNVVITRLPFIPNQDLVFLGAGLALAPVAGAADGAVAGMLAAEAALMQVVNLALFLATSGLAAGPRPAPDRGA